MEIAYAIGSPEQAVRFKVSTIQGKARLRGREWYENRESRIDNIPPLPAQVAPSTFAVARSTFNPLSPASCPHAAAMETPRSTRTVQAMPRSRRIR